MNSAAPIVIYMVSGLVVAISQLILKLTALNPKKNKGIMRYMDIRIIMSYTMLLGTIFMNMIAMRNMPYKYAPVLSSVSYIFVLILGKVFLNERIGGMRAAGILLIFMGMIVFYVG